jgi:thioredoxin-like negative regulator of GroEL
MIERLLLLIALLAAGYLAYRLLTRRQMRAAADQAPADPLLADVAPGAPVIVYFTTPTCAPCRLQQTPTLEALQRELAGLRVIRVDAEQNPDAADRWRVFSVPTLFVLDGSGQPRHVYNGVVDAATLRRDLERVS